jgi:Uma2 family endonuclease
MPTIDCAVRCAGARQTGHNRNDMSSRPLSYVTPEEYLAQERIADVKHEYIDGAIVAMAGGSPAHSLIAANVGRGLGNRLTDSSCLVFSSDLRVSVKWGKLITYPDVSVVCGKPQYVDAERDTIVNPTLIVEVLSPSTNNYDRGEKSRLYRMLPSLAEYLLIEQEPVEIEHYRRLPTGHWEIETLREKEAVIKLESVGCELPVKDVYRGIDRL